MNNGKTPFDWKARGRSFKYAWHGLRRLPIEEHNARLHLVAAILAILFGWWLKISSAEWCIVIMCIGAVFMAEAFNSAIEALADHAETKNNPLIGKAKDVAAAGVLCVAISSAISGIIIFLPKLLNLFLL